MGTDQQFCLRWNNFHTSITSAFESLRDDEDFVDITLACDGKQVKAHKMVLSACSPYFRNLLKGNPCQHPIVFLKDVTFANLASILDFMYHGEVNVSHNDLATFLKTAEALKVRGLAEDDKKKDAENYIESSSPGPPRDPPDPGSPKHDETSATDTHLSDSSPPPSKRHRRRSGASVQSAEDTSETVLSDLREASVKNEPQEFNDEDEMLGHSLDGTGDLKNDNVNSDVNDDRNFGHSESVSISRSQAAMQQLQESFGSFLPSMSQSSGFMPHGATDMARSSFPLEGVQGLPPGISTLPGPSMSQSNASQDGSQVHVKYQREETEATFIFGERNKRLVLLEGFKFGFHKKLVDKSERWICTKRKCKAFIKLCESGHVIERNGIHNHEEAGSALINRQMLSNHLKRKVEDKLHERPSKIIQQELAQSDLDSLTTKDISRIKSNLYHSRSKI